MTSIDSHKDFFGQIFYIENKKRFGVFSSAIIIEGNIFYQAYPISFAVYLASDSDLILTDAAIFKSNAIMVEYWNPILIKAPIHENITLKGTFEKDSFDILREFLSKKLLAMSSKYKIFTGPPINSSQDIRVLFKKTELEAFLDFKKDSLTLLNVFQIYKPTSKNIKLRE